MFSKGRTPVVKSISPNIIDTDTVITIQGLLQYFVQLLYYILTENPSKSRLNRNILE